MQSRFFFFMTVAHTSLAMNVRKKYTHILQRKNNCVWLSVIPVIRNFFSFKVISCSLPGGETICAHPLLCRCNDFCSLELTFLLPPQAHSHIHTHTPTDTAEYCKRSRRQCFCLYLPLLAGRCGR